MKILAYERPKSVDNVLELMEQGGTIIGGGTWLKILPKKVSIAIDISRLKLEFILSKDDGIEIGAMTTLQSLIGDESIKGLGAGIISQASRQIMGVQFRNIATVGGTVIGRYGFSDLLTPLLALNTKLYFVNNGEVSLEDYLTGKKIKNDLLTSIVVENHPSCIGAFQTLKKTSNDFAILNVAVTKNDLASDKYRIAVGARPSVAKLAKKAMARLNGATIDDETDKYKLAKEVGKLAAEELSFGTNVRGSKEYRAIVCENIVLKLIMEVL